jgi:hypothetical protein
VFGWAPTLYPIVLLFHSWFRWVVLAVLLFSLVHFARSWAGKRPFADGDARVARILVGTIDLQLALGLLLYVFLSPFTAAGFADLGAAMRTAPLRFFTIEHPFAMVLAVVVLHARSDMTKKLGADPRRHRSLAAACGVALLLIAISIPWPGLPYARPLLRLP